MDVEMESILPVWRSLTQSQQELVQRRITLRRYEKNECIDDEKQDAGLWSLLQGQIAFLFRTEDGRQMTLLRMGGKGISVAPLYLTGQGSPYDIQVMSEAPTVLCCMPGALCDALAIQSPPMQAFFQQKTQTLINELCSLTAHLAFGSLHQRLLLQLEAYSQLQSGRLLRITHELLARDLGTSREVVTRLLKQCEREGLVRLGRGKIQLMAGDTPQGRPLGLRESLPSAGAKAPSSANRASQNFFIKI